MRSFLGLRECLERSLPLVLRSCEAKQPILKALLPGVFDGKVVGEKRPPSLTQLWCATSSPWLNR